MDLSSLYLRKLSLILRAGTTFNSQGQLNYPFLLLFTLACTALILCDLAGFLEHGIKYEVLHGRVYETVIFVFIILHVPILIRKRSNVYELVELLLEPFNEVSFGAKNAEIVKDFLKWVNIFGTILIFNNFLAFGCCTMVLGPLCTIPFYPVNTTIQGLPLPVGRLPFHTESKHTYAAFYVTFSFAIMYTCAFHSSWFLLFIYSSLKIKAQLRMLVYAMETLDEQAAIRCTVHTEMVQCSRYRLSAKQMLNKCAKDILGEIISQHTKIMRFVNLVNNTFDKSLIIFIQASIIACAILLQQITNVAHQTVKELSYKINMTFAGLFSIWVFSLCGQSIVTESNSFCSALYDYDWTDKPLKLKNSILLMMTVAARPLKIKVGGIYTLDMVSYNATVQAVYSYINLLLSLRANQLNKQE